MRQMMEDRTAWDRNSLTCAGPTDCLVTCSGSKGTRPTNVRPNVRTRTANLKSLGIGCHRRSRPKPCHSSGRSNVTTIANGSGRERHEYEQHVRGPMLALLEQLGPDLRSFAPELVCDPKVSLYRIYRDTRFSDDKSPLKTHVAAHFPLRGFPRGTGAGLYFEIAPQWVWIGGGIYMPSSTDLRAIRAHIADTHPQLHRLVLRPAFARLMGGVTGAQLTRVPVGYAERPSGCRVSAVQAVSRQPRARRRIRHESALLPGARRHLPRHRTTRAVPEHGPGDARHGAASPDRRRTLQATAAGTDVVGAGSGFWVLGSGFVGSGSGSAFGSGRVRVRVRVREPGLLTP